MSKFLNRILGMPVDLQNRLFQYFTDTMEEIVNRAKRSGNFDMGILDLGSSGDGCRKSKTTTWISAHPTGTAKTELHTVIVERGMSWTDASAMYNCASTILKAGRNYNLMFILYRPNTGLQIRKETYAKLKLKYKKVTPEKAKLCWEGQYTSHAKVDFDKRDKRGRSALHQVCLEGFESITSLLIGRGILIDASGKESHTPLILACKEGQGDIVKLLLDAGADKDCEDKTGCTCFHYHTFIIFTGKFVTLLT